MALLQIYDATLAVKEFIKPPVWIMQDIFSRLYKTGQGLIRQTSTSKWPVFFKYFSLESIQPRRRGRTHLLGSQVLHAPGQLVGARHQVLEGHLLLGNAVDVIGILHPGWPPGAQVFPKVAFRGVFDDDIERPCGWKTRAGEAANPRAALGQLYQGARSYYNSVLYYFFFNLNTQNGTHKNRTPAF